MDKKEGGKSQCYRRENNGLRLLPSTYTSIAEINIFRLRQENILSSTQRKIQKQRNRSSRQASAEIHSALSGGAIHLDDGQTRPKLDYY